MRNLFLISRIVKTLFIVFVRCGREYFLRTTSGGVPHVPPSSSVFFPRRTDAAGIKAQEELAIIFGFQGRKCYFVRDAVKKAQGEVTLNPSAFFRWADLIVGVQIWWAFVLGDQNFNQQGDTIGKMEIVLRCSLLRAFRTSDLSINERISALCLWMCVAAQRNFRLAEWASQSRDAIVVCADPGYIAEYEFCTVFTGARKTILLANQGFDKKHLFMRKVTGEECFEHPLHLSCSDLSSCKNNLNPDQVLEKLTASYNSKGWYNYVGTVENIEPDSVEFCQLQKKLGSDDNDTISVFPHIFWDGTFFLGRNCFDNYHSWFEWLCAYIAGDNTGRKWIIKLHPANLGKGERSETAKELYAIRRFGLHTNTNVVILAYESKISALDLLKVSDAVLTVRGTIALEAALFGKTAICAGGGRHSIPGLVIESEDAVDLRRILDERLYDNYIPDRQLAADIFAIYFKNKSLPINHLLDEHDHIKSDVTNFLSSDQRHFFIHGKCDDAYN